MLVYKTLTYYTTSAETKVLNNSIVTLYAEDNKLYYTILVINKVKAYARNAA